MANSRTGKASTTSMKRDSSESTQPLKKPAIVPSVTPISTAIPVAMNATSSEIRAP